MESGKENDVERNKSEDNLRHSIHQNLNAVFPFSAFHPGSPQARA